MVLEALGHRCIVATRAAEAWTLCRGNQFDCAFIHATLDGASGLALASRLSHERAIRPRHVILMSALPKHEFTRQIRDGVVDAYLKKPSEPQDVAAVLEQCLAH